MCSVVGHRTSVCSSCRLRQTESISRLVIEHECDRIKEILHESDRDRLVYPMAQTLAL